MEIHPRVHIVDLALYLEDSCTLVLSDLHLGYESEMHKRGVLVPKVQYKEVVHRLAKIFAALKLHKWKLNEIVLNGDVKHEFGKISEQEWREVLRLLDYLQEHCKKIIVVEGNRDPVLKPIAAKRELVLVKEYRIGDVLLVHGDEAPELKGDMKGDTGGIGKLGTPHTKPKLLIMGHEHPAVCLREGAKVERYKCFMKGVYKKVSLICLPSFNPLTEGTDMITEDRLSPLLQGDIGNFDIYIVADTVYHFGKLKKLV